MRTLYHFPLSPFARKIRLALAEKKLDFALVLEKPWERRPEFCALNPAATVPVMVEEDGSVVPHSGIIIEYLEENYGPPHLLPKTAADRVEARRLQTWFDEVFHAEVTVPLLYEKVHKRLANARGQSATPDMHLIRDGIAALRAHLEAIGRFAEERRWLAGEALTVADLAAAAHLSCLDYLGDVPWNQYEAAKEWYVRLKSRPSFRPLLQDVIPGMPPVRHYTNLDF
jgi:glutathione S-transferase